jgi:hypothetical protein
VTALALALTAVLNVSFDLEANAAVGFGSRTSFGAVTSVTVGQELWTDAAGVGSLEAGLLLGYQLEPYALQAAYLPLAVVTGANHRLEALVLVGHGMRLLSSRRLLIGLHLFGGWTHLLVRGRLVNESLGIARDVAADAGRLTGARGPRGARPDRPRQPGLRSGHFPTLLRPPPRRSLTTPTRTSRGRPWRAAHPASRGHRGAPQSAPQVDEVPRCDERCR